LPVLEPGAAIGAYKRVCWSWRETSRATGYRRLHVLLCRDGTGRINHKRVWRVHRELGLSVKRTRRERLQRTIRPRAVLTGPNEEWAIDFASDMAATDQRLRIFSVIDICPIPPGRDQVAASFVDSSRMM